MGWVNIPAESGSTFRWNQHSYNNADQLTRIADARTSGANPFRWMFGYGRDALGQVSSATEQMPGMRHMYSYDALNRLTGDTRSNRTSTTWGYDAADNLKSVVDMSGGTATTKSFTYDGSNDQLSSLQTAAPAARRISFIAHPDGGVAVVPEGAIGPTPTRSGGFQFLGGSGGHGLDSKVTGVRFMDPTKPWQTYSYPKGRVTYMNIQDQVVDPYTGRTVSKSDPWWHIPWP